MGLNGVFRFLHESGVDLTPTDNRGRTPLDTAPGRTGGFDFGGSAGVVRQDTAAVIAELTGVPPLDAPALSASFVSAQQAAGGAQAADDPVDDSGD